jgi:hypothetical protein
MPPLDLFAAGARLSSAIGDPQALALSYSDHIEAALSEVPWSADRPEGVRIPWRLAKEARNYHRMRAAFESPGLYIFGSQGGIPLYMGKTETTLWKRLARRYVVGERSQCQLTATYEQGLLASGMRAFPPEVRAWYAKQYRNSTVRLVGALTFAQHGINGIWFTLIPITDPHQVASVERSLIPVADAWNESHAFPPMLNLHYSSVWRARTETVRSDADATRSRKGPAR